MSQIEPVRTENYTPQMIEERIDQFVERKKQAQAKLESEGRRSNHSISDLIQRSKSLPPEIVDNIFNPYLKQKIASDSINDVRKSLHSMRLKINTLDSRKRFLILETMDFFRSKISIGKLIPAIQLLQGIDKKKAFLQFVIPAFQTIKRNVETLVSTEALFTQKTLHLNRGSLYSFISDLANFILPVFKQDFRDRFSGIVSPVDLLVSILKPYQSLTASGDNSLYRHMIDDDAQIEKVLLNFIVSIQSHGALFNYSVKRHGYYKLFLNDLAGNNRFQEYDPYLLSKILAGCFISNQQIKPNAPLIEAMIDKERYARPSTVKARRRFIDKLAPSTAVTIIQQFKTQVKLLLKSKLPAELSEILDLSIKSILLKIWSGFTKLANDGYYKLTAPLEIVLNQIKKTLRSFIEDETKAEEWAIQELNKPVVALIPKQPGSPAFLKKNYLLVAPDVIGYRGIWEGANLKDFAYNARFFKKGEITQLEFTYCFRRLFEFLASKQNKMVSIVTHNKQKGIVEYHASFLFKQYLICLGLTHLKSEKVNEVQEKDIFPYILLFTEAANKKTGRIASRVITVKGKQRIFNESVMIEENSYIYYKSILYLLHLLPNEDWNASASQACIKFLIRELKKVSE